MSLLGRMDSRYRKLLSLGIGWKCWIIECGKSFIFMNRPNQILLLLLLLLLLQLNVHVTIMHLAIFWSYVNTLLSVNMCVSSSSHVSISLEHRTLDAHLIFGHPIPGGLANPKLIISCHKNNTYPCRKVHTAIWKKIFVFWDNFNITKFVNYTMFLWPLQDIFFLWLEL
jgi:hypothetical protein